MYGLYRFLMNPKQEMVVVRSETQTSHVIVLPVSPALPCRDPGIWIRCSSNLISIWRGLGNMVHAPSN
jgi:hypothetical protein